MPHHRGDRTQEPTLYLPLCVIGILLLAFAPRAHGQQIAEPSPKSEPTTSPPTKSSGTTLLTASTK